MAGTDGRIFWRRRRPLAGLRISWHLLQLVPSRNEATRTNRTQFYRGSRGGALSSLSCHCRHCHITDGAGAAEQFSIGRVVADSATEFKCWAVVDLLRTHYKIRSYPNHSVYFTSACLLQQLAAPLCCGLAQAFWTSSEPVRARIGCHCREQPAASWKYHLCYFHYFPVLCTIISPSLFASSKYRLWQ
jgi:hypothetical protein